MIRLFVIGLVLSSLGCTKTVSRKVARFEVGQPHIVQLAPRTGRYEVKWGDEDGNKLKSRTPIVCLIQKGEPVGFETLEDGTVLAIAGEKQIKPLHVPRGTKYALWHHYEKKQTQFGRECEKFWTTAGVVAAGVGTAAVVGGVIALDLMDNEDCDDSHSKHSRYHPH